ncbi:MAG TPA: tetratricopeptide repeat protein [Woeseiaceae bacterium]|nr:tetratricopeptide repeat protein [Woeseiaceae bacterium]
MKTLRIFISSPGDVFEERAIANRVIERLQSEYIGKVVLESVLWEHEPLVATSTFQHQIVKPSEADIVVAILWSRLGTKLPKEFVRADGSRYESGTEFEFEEAIEGFRKSGKPDLLVYRKTAPPSVRLDDEKELLDRLAQKKKLDEFVDKWFHDKTEGTLIAAFHAFEAPSDFENLLENHLHRLVDRQIPASIRSTSEARAVWKKGSPFRGLEAFEFEHAPVFFGRTKAVSDILQALRSQDAEGRSFVLVLGMSGGGKSSVVRAGVLPMLTKPGVIEGVDVWRRAVFRPTDVRGDLFTGLAKALLRDTALPSLDEDKDGPEELAQVLRSSPQAAASMIKGALSREKRKDGKKADARLALLVDQMEEMYTQDEVTQDDREAFVDVLDALARCGRVWVIGTLRSDFYQAVGKIRKLVALKEGDGQYDLLPPTASEMGQMIRLPTRAAGLRFEEDPASSERLDDMLRDAAAEHPEVLPLLQFTLEELYQRRTEDGLLTLAAYRDLGGVEGSLAQRAETVFKDLPDDVEAELPKVLNALVSIERDGYEQIGRKRAPWTDATTGKSRELIETFVKNRLFVTELADDGTAVVTVAHEALLWHWPRVKDWVAQNRENLRIRSRIAAAAGRWKNEDRPSDLLLPSGKPLVEAESLLEQDLELSEDEARFISASIARAKRMQRLKAGVVVTLAVLGVIATFSAYLATQQRDLANQARSRAVVEAETAKQTTDFMVDLFNVADPSEARGNSITAREIMDKGASRIEQELSAQPAIQATLMETMGAVYMSLGLYDQSTGLLQSALDKRRALFGDEHLEVARSMHRLGDVLKLKAEYEPALQNYRDALAMRRQLLGDEHVETASTMFELADLLGRMGDFPGGEPLYREALAIQRKLLGAENAAVAKSLEGLGLNLFDQGNAQAGVPLLREAVAMQRKLHNGPHPDLAEALNNLGFVTSDNKEAEKLFREALAMKRVLYSDAPHPEIAMGLNNVAYTLHVEGEYRDAELLYREAIEMNRELLGNDHPDIAMALNNLAFVIREEGDLDSTIEMARESLETYRRTLGDEHPSVARGMNNLAMWLLEAGDYEAAEPLLRQALELRVKLLGPEHAEVAGTKILLAGLLVDTGRNDEALELAAHTREIYAREFGEDHWRTASAAAAEGAALASLGRREEAGKLLLAGYEVLRNNADALPWFVSSAARWRAKIT